MDRGYGKSSSDRRGGSNRDSRSGPYKRESSNHDGGNEGVDVDALETPKNSIKVSGTTDVNRLAGQICDACRGEEPPALLTIGNNSINQAVKGIAVARMELRNEGIELAFQPAFRHVNRTKPLIAFYLSTTPTSREGSDRDDSELAVASGSKITPVAGAIAGRVREGKHVIMTAIGVDAVTNAVLAAGNARVFLEKDSMDIKVQPEFTKLEKNGHSLNALRFSVISESI